MQKVTFMTVKGAGEATRESVGHPWQISSPYGNDEFYGSTNLMAAYIRETLADKLVKGERFPLVQDFDYDVWVNS